MHPIPQAAILSIALWMGGAGCSKKSPPPAPVPASVAADDGMRMTPEEFAATIPEIGGPPGYTGSESCKACHKDQFSSWHRSYHRTMTQIANGDAVQARFEGVVLTNDNTRFLLSEKGGEHWVRMERIDSDQANEAVEVRMGMVTGSHHMQVFWLAEGHGNMQIGFPFTWLIPEKRWVPRHSTFIRPPDMGHGPEIWNIVCSRCHTTGVEPHANMAERRIETRVAELGISCEACHGPGKTHVDAQLAAQQSGAPRKVAIGEIVHPENLDPVRASQVCGFCHSMKWIDRSENWRENGFRYRPGDDLEKTTPIIRPGHSAGIAGLDEYLRRNPEILKDFFWPDGMIRVSGREYNGVIESPCYKGGKFSCLSCHSMHESEPDDQLALRGKSNAACVQCHEQYKDPAIMTAHTRHGVDSTGSECYNCHMPHSTYGVLKAIRSHQISSPRVADDLNTGRPNACNLCHLDQTLAWTAERLEEWYKQTKPRLPDAATNISRAVQLALTGDAAQRALAAWHFSWPPALEAAGKDWPPAILAQLLDDPYAAVRCVAERSLKQFSNLIPPSYDYIIEPRARTFVREEVWKKMLEVTPFNEIPAGRLRLLLLSPSDLETQRAEFEQRMLFRDKRPVRLRE